MFDVLFILKRGMVSGGYCDAPIQSSGLKNSAQFVVNMLNKNGISAMLEVAVDANSIDHLVDKWRPKIVILEAIWCPPEKLRENIRLHPRVQWIVRVHSEIPFLAMEGMAIEWLRAYSSLPKVIVSVNSFRTTDDLEWVIMSRVLWLPNYYSPIRTRPSEFTRRSLDIGCFGAMRPLKNQLSQAIAAIKYSVGNELMFHVNAGRVEQGGNQVLKNLRAMFEGRPRIHLVEHPWLPHDAFLNLLSRMDMSMAVSLTESFNIVSADAVMCGIPIVVSHEVQWTNSANQADPTNIESIVQTMHRVLGFRKNHLIRDNEERLMAANNVSEHKWVKEMEARL